MRHFASAGRERLDRFAVAASVDLHCHCLPTLDDGPATLRDSLELCQLLVADGITAVVATPHQLGRYDLRNSPRVIREAVAQLNTELARASIPLEVLPGGDVRIDERLLRLIDQDQVCTLADRGTAILLELPHELYVEPKTVLAQLAATGRQGIITHPERYPYLQRRPALVEAMLENGAVLQLTAGSLVGDFGAAAHAAAWAWLRRGWVAVVATDAHGSRRPPRMAAAIEVIEQELGHDVARRVCVTGPLEMLGPLAAAGAPEPTALRSAV